MYYNIVDGPLTWNVVGMGPQSRFLLMETTRGGGRNKNMSPPKFVFNSLWLGPNRPRVKSFKLHKSSGFIMYII